MRFSRCCWLFLYDYLRTMSKTTSFLIRDILGAEKSVTQTTNSTADSTGSGHDEGTQETPCTGTESLFIFYITCRCTHLRYYSINLIHITIKRYMRLHPCCQYYNSRHAEDGIEHRTTVSATPTEVSFLCKQSTLKTRSCTYEIFER